MKRFLLLLCFVAQAVSAQEQAQIVSVQKIYDKGGHNAFTDLTRFQNRFYCCFREADAHVGGDGKIRIMISSNGDNWVSFAEIAEKGTDLRDPKLEVTPDGKRLYLLCGGSNYGGGTELKGRRPRYSMARW